MGSIPVRFHSFRFSSSTDSNGNTCNNVFSERERELERERAKERERERKKDRERERGRERAREKGREKGRRERGREREREREQEREYQYQVSIKAETYPLRPPLSQYGDDGDVKGQLHLAEHSRTDVTRSCTRTRPDSNQ